jgi:hypothetical protein
MVLFYGEKANWHVWQALLHSVETGKPAYQHVFGLTGWEYRAKHPETAAHFTHFMTELAASVAQTPQPLKTLEQPLHLKHPAIVETVPRTRIECTGGGSSSHSCNI